jgi:fatty acid desaturase
MAEPRRYCQDSISFTDGELEITVYITCQMLVVTARGTKVEHIHHHRDLNIPGCEQARVSWTRRR